MLEPLLQVRGISAVLRTISSDGAVQQIFSIAVRKISLIQFRQSTDLRFKLMIVKYFTLKIPDNIQFYRNISYKLPNVFLQKKNCNRKVFYGGFTSRFARVNCFPENLSTDGRFLVHSGTRPFQFEQALPLLFTKNLLVFPATTRGELQHRSRITYVQ